MKPEEPTLLFTPHQHQYIETMIAIALNRRTARLVYSAPAPEPAAGKGGNAGPLHVFEMANVPAPLPVSDEGAKSEVHRLHPHPAPPPDYAGSPIKWVGKDELLDEAGIEEEAEALWRAWDNGETGHGWPGSGRKDDWRNVARAARAMREKEREEIKRLNEDIAEFALRAEEFKIERDNARDRQEKQRKAMSVAQEIAQNKRAECDSLRDEIVKLRPLESELPALRAKLDAAERDNERLRSEAPPRICECGHADSKHGLYAGSHPTSCASGCPCKKFALRTAPPASVYVTDAEALAEDLVGAKRNGWRCQHDNAVGDVGGLEVWCRECVAEKVRKHSRAADVEAVAKAIDDVWTLHPGVPGTGEQQQRIARAVLQFLGISLGGTGDVLAGVDREIEHALSVALEALEDQNTASESGNGELLADAMLAVRAALASVREQIEQGAGTIEADVRTTPHARSHSPAPDFSPCWFVEKPGSPTRWLVKTGASPATWTANANEAQRFPDEWTAKREIRSMPSSEGHLLATEHSWFASPASPEPASERGWTEEQRSDACSIAALVIAKGPLGYEGNGTDALCAAIQKAAPAFVPTVKLPERRRCNDPRSYGRDMGYNAAINDCAAALTAQGLRVAERAEGQA